MIHHPAAAIFLAASNQFVAQGLAMWPADRVELHGCPDEIQAQLDKEAFRLPWRLAKFYAWKKPCAGPANRQDEHV